MQRSSPPLPPKLLTLELWAERRFEPPPTKATLRNWKDKGHIIPAPIKIGQKWYVEEGAQHMDELMRAPRLIDRVRRG